MTPAPEPPGRDPADSVRAKLSHLARLLGDPRASRRQIADAIRAVPGFAEWLVAQYGAPAAEGESPPPLGVGVERVLERHGLRVVAGLLERFARRRRPGAPPTA